MALGTGNNLRELYGLRVTGQDGYFDSFELAIFDGYSPGNTGATIYTAPLVVFTLPAPWAIYDSRYGTIGVTTQTEPTTKAGVAAFFRLIGIKSGTPSPLLQGTVGTRGSGADVTFSAVGWPLGLPITLRQFTVYPPPAKNP